MATRSASAGRRVKLHAGGSRRQLNDPSPYAAKVRPGSRSKGQLGTRAEKVKLRSEPRSRSKGCQSVASSAFSAWTEGGISCRSLGSPKSALYAEPPRSLGSLNRALTPPHDPPSCWPWSPRNMNASVSQSSLCQVKDLKRSFHCKASQPHALLFLNGAREKQQEGQLGCRHDKSQWRRRMSGGGYDFRCQEAEVPIAVLPADDLKDTVDKMGRSITDESLGSPSRKKNRLRPSIIKPKTSKGGSSAEPMGPALEFAHAEMLASVAEAEARYVVKDQATEYEMPRMKALFHRFALDGEVQKENLPMIFNYLSILKVEEEKVREAGDSVSAYPSLDFHDFCAVYERVVLREREALYPKLEAWLDDPKPRGDDIAEQMRVFLKSLGLISTKETVTEMLQAGGLQNRRCDCMEELWRVVAAHRACEGFSYEEIDRAKEEHDRMSKDTPSRFISSQVVSEALLSLGTVYCAEYLNGVIGELGEERLQKGPLSFYEFMIMYRRLHHITMKTMADSFEKADTDRDGMITVNEATDCLRQLGFTLLRAELQEMLELTGAEKEERLHFDAVYALLVEARNQHGFTRAESDDLKVHFDAFCDEDGEMPNLQMYDLLRYIGHESTLDEVKELLDQVDYNHNGTMDRREYLRLMRLQKEANLTGYRNAWCSSKMRCGRKAFQVVNNALHARLNKHPEILGRLLASTTRAEITRAAGDFDSFAQLAEHLRRQIPLESRKYASFKEVEYESLRQIFSVWSCYPDGSVSLRDFLTMMEEVRDVHTKGGRMWLFEALNEARHAAKDCGVDDKEAGNDNSPRVHFMPVLHFVRQMVQRHLRQVTIKENDVLSALKFSKGEVAQFRALFRKLHKEHKESQSASKGDKTKGSKGGKAGSKLKVPAGRRRSTDDAGEVGPLNVSDNEDEQGEEDPRPTSFGEWLESFTRVQQVPGDNFIATHYSLLEGKPATGLFPAIAEEHSVCAIRQMQDIYTDFVAVDRYAQEGKTNPAMLGPLADAVEKVITKYTAVIDYYKQGSIACSNRSYVLAEWELLIEAVGSLRSLTQEACADYILATQGTEPIFQERSDRSMAALLAAFRALAYGTDTLPAPPSQSIFDQVINKVKPAFDLFIVAVTEANTMNVVLQGDNVAVQGTEVKRLYFDQALSTLASFPVGRLEAGQDQQFRVNQMVKLSFMFIYDITATTTTLQNSIAEFDAVHIMLKDGGPDIPAIVDQRDDLLTQWSRVDGKWKELKQLLLTRSVADVPNLQATKDILIEEMIVLQGLFAIPDQPVAETFPWMFVAYGAMGLFLLSCACGAVYIHFVSRRKKSTQNQNGWSQA